MGSIEPVLSISDASPEQKLLAAVFIYAMRDARRGDAEARSWLATNGAGVLAFLVPRDVDADALLARL
jgi:hypothetical protein